MLTRYSRQRSRHRKRYIYWTAVSSEVNIVEGATLVPVCQSYLMIDWYYPTGGAKFKGAATKPGLRLL